MSLTTHTNPHPHPQPRQHTTHRTGPPRRKSGINLHRTSSHGGIHATASALALTTNQNQAVPRMERQDSGASKASDEVSVTSAPATGAGRTRGKHVHGMHHVARPGGVGPRRKSQVHIGDHARRGSRNSRSDTNLSRLGLTSLARANSRTHLAKGEPGPEPEAEAEAEAEEEEWEEAPGAEAREEGGSDDDEDDDEEEEGDELVIPIKKKPTPRAKDLPSKGFAAVVASPEQHDVQPMTPAPRTETLAPAPPTPREPSPAPSDAGTLIATPTKSHTAPVPTGRHIRTRNSHTSLQSLTAGSLRSFLTGPHHPLSSPKPGKRREGTAPPVVSGETARGAWAGPAVEGMPTPTRTAAERPTAAAASSLRKASFTGSPSGGDNVSGLPPPGRLSAHSVAQRAALLPTMSSRPSSTGAADATRQQMERESVNLVSRFVTLPSPTSAQGTQGIFPESPFAGAHASLVRTLMEEGAQLLPLDTPTNPSLRRTETSRAITPKPPRTTTDAPPYGAGQAPQGMEWVAGLTPFEMSVQRCLAQRKGAVRLATGKALGPLGA